MLIYFFQKADDKGTVQTDKLTVRGKKMMCVDTMCVHTLRVLLSPSCQRILKE